MSVRWKSSMRHLRSEPPVSREVGKERPGWPGGYQQSEVERTTLKSPARRRGRLSMGRKEGRNWL